MVARSRVQVHVVERNEAVAAACPTRTRSGQGAPQADSGHLRPTESVHLGRPGRSGMAGRGGTTVAAALSASGALL